MQQKTKEVLPSHLLHVGIDDEKFFLTGNVKPEVLQELESKTFTLVNNAIPDVFDGEMEDDFRGEFEEQNIYPYARSLILSNNCPYWIECLSFLKPIIIEDREITSESTDEEVERRR
jgi:hypothetical protein